MGRQRRLTDEQIQMAKKHGKVCLQLVMRKSKPSISLYLSECPEYKKSHNVCCWWQCGGKDVYTLLVGSEEFS